jgi:Mg/Co/Ni transporter MgtE
MIHYYTRLYLSFSLVGSGGNAGNQSAVRVIRGIALGTLNRKTYGAFVKKECVMAVTLSFCIALCGLLRSVVSFQASFAECLAISATLCAIVLVSVVLGMVIYDLVLS